MSNARSPREVCSTTMGTSGLMVLASFRSRARIPARTKRWPRPSRAASLAIGRRAAGRLPAPRARGRRRAVTSPASRAREAPSSARSGPGVHSLSRALACSTEIGVRVLGEQVDGGALGEVLAQVVEAPGLLAAARAASRASCARARRRARSASSTSPSAGSMPSASTTAASTASRRSACSASGAASRDDLLLVAPGDLQVGLLRDALVARASAACAPTARCARASTSASGTSTVRLAHDGVEHGLAELGLDALARRLSQQLGGDVLAQLVERVEAGRVGRRSRRRARAAPCALTSLTVTANCAVAARRARRRRSRRGR